MKAVDSSAWETWQRKALFTQNPNCFHLGAGVRAQFSPDGRRVVTVSEDNTARLWDTATGQAEGGPMKRGGAVTCATFSPDGRQVLTGSLDRTARLWDAAPGRPLVVQKLDREGRCYSSRS